MIRKREMRNVVVLSGLVLLVLLVCLPAGPAWSAIYYVSTDGNDTNPGTSPKLAWRTITHAAKQAQAGDLVRIKGGDYGFEQVTIESSGTPEAPIRFEGYDGAVKLEGKVEKVTKGRQKGKMRLVGGGVVIRGSYIKVSGITALRYGRPFGVAGHHNTLERCTAGIGGSDAIYVSGHHNEVRHCTAFNSGMSGIGLKYAHDITIADCYSYNDPCLVGIYPGVDTATDYCYSATDSTKSAVFTRCRGDFKTIHSGHGICITRNSGPCSNIRVTECEMYNGWEHFGVRHGSHDITFENCYCEGSKRKNSSQGFYYRTGAHNITVKNCRAKGLACGLNAENNPRYIAIVGKEGNTRNITFENCIATDCTIGIGITALNTRVLNCLSARNEYGMDISGLKTIEGLVVKGCIISRNDVGIRAPFPTTKAVTHCNVWGNQTRLTGKASLGDGCISKDPQFVVIRGMDNWHFKETSPCKDMGPYAADPKASIGMR